VIGNVLGATAALVLVVGIRAAAYYPYWKRHQSERQ
jgi:hypothetical protein